MSESSESRVATEANSLRRLGQDTAVYLTGTVLARAISFVMLPLYTRYLTPSDYGILQMLDLSVEVATILISAGATAGTMRFYFKTDSEARRRDILSTAFLLQLGLNLAGTALLLALSPLIWKHVLDGSGTVAMVRIAAVNLTLGSLTAMPLLLLQARQQSARFVGVSVLKLVLQVSLNIFLVVVLNWGPIGILVSTMVTQALLGLTLGTQLLLYTGLRFRRDVWSDLRRFGLPTKVTTAGAFILSFGDRFFLEHYHGLAIVGVYGVAYQFGFLLTGMFNAPFQRAWTPQRYRLATAPRPTREAAYNRAFLAGSILLVSAATGISLLIRPVLRIMVTEPFRAAADLVPIILAAHLFHSLVPILDFGNQVSERTKYTAYATWISVVAIIILYATLIPPLAALGAAIATLLAMALRAWLHHYWSQRNWPVTWDWRPHLKLVAAGVGAVALAWLLAPTGTLRQVAIGLGLLVAYGMVVWTQVIDPRDRATLVTILRRRAPGATRAGSVLALFLQDRSEGGSPPR